MDYLTRFNINCMAPLMTRAYKVFVSVGGCNLKLVTTLVIQKVSGKYN